MGRKIYYKSKKALVRELRKIIESKMFTVGMLEIETGKDNGMYYIEVER